ncbi:glycine zipper domain-containing protein [Sphingopyxis sp.]|uniref:glycine zipper domain-containing protein n=1 Tax=Sphingopyxis sp. TaxID=1908224 RepID=UPI003D0C8769
MRTFVLLGVAAASLLLAGRAGAEAPMVDARAATSLSGIASFNHDTRPSLDYGAPADPDVRVYTGYPDRVPSEVEYRRVSGYDAEGRWTGTWNGTYESPDGRRYDGSYEGTVEGHGAGYPPPPHHGNYGDGYDPRHDAEMERRCGRGGTVAGAVVGGVLGGVVGNRVAGRGDRTAGTLVGTGLGAVAGAAIGDASDKKKCDAWWSSREDYRGGGAYHGGSGYQQGGYGYGYYTPGVVVTTIITTGAPVITETVETTTRTIYENVPVRKRYVAKKRWKPKAKPRCAC